MELIRQLPVIAEPDVPVCSAGHAGMGAAIGTGCLDAGTRVVERTGNAGGLCLARLSRPAANFSGRV